MGPEDSEKEELLTLRFVNVLEVFRLEPKPEELFWLLYNLDKKLRIEGKNDWEPGNGGPWSPRYELVIRAWKRLGLVDYNSEAGKYELNLEKLRTIQKYDPEGLKRHEQIYRVKVLPE